MANWKNQFLQLFSSGILDDAEAAFELKHRNLPNRLYKFFPPSEYAFEGLQNNTVWLASPATFNDPFDSGFTMDSRAMVNQVTSTEPTEQLEGLTELGVSAAELSSLLSGKSDDALLDKLTTAHPETDRDELKRLIAFLPTLREKFFAKHILKPIEDFVQNGLKIACFTEHASSLLLWAHYAASHTGFCVEYCFKDVPPDLPQQRLLFPVFYSSTRFIWSPAPPTKGGVPNDPILAALHKATEWSYEQEWRIVNPDGRPVRGLAIPMTLPKAVYVGLRMEDAHRQRIEQICSSTGVPVREVALSSERYEMIISGES